MGNKEKENIAKVTLENKMSNANLVMTMDAVRVRDKAGHLPLLKREFELLAEAAARTEWGDETVIDWQTRKVVCGPRVHQF